MAFTDKLRSYIQKKTDIYRAQLKNKKLLNKIAMFAMLFIILYLIGTFIPEGFDWKVYYKAGTLHPIWTPWSLPIIRVLGPLGFEFVFALSVLAIGIRAYRYRPSFMPLALALLSLPTLWVFFMGNLDGLTLFGLLIMPIGVPLVLMKPQVVAFALLARKNWMTAAVIFGLLTLVVWGFWPTRLLMVLTPAWKAEWTQDISLFPWSLIPGLPLLWLSRGDEDLLMAAGSLITPHLFPYHFIVLMPALARMSTPWMLLTFFVSWTPLLANWLGSNAWHFGNLLSLCFWFGIYLSSGQSFQALHKDLLPKIKSGKIH